MMVSNIKKKNYLAFGLIVESEISFNELEVKENNCEADISIYIDHTEHKEVLLKLAPYEFGIENNNVTFYVPETAYFSIENGKDIIISPFNDPDMDLIKIYILGTCMGIILMQRKILPLHGSALEINGKAYAFVGESGAGKSTIASALMNKGYKIISDDVIPVVVRKDSNPLIIPSYPQQKLWQESLDKFGLDSRHYQSIYQRETKYSIPVKNNFATSPIILSGVFELEKSSVNKMNFEPILGLNRFDTLSKHTYRNFLIPQLGLLDWHFQTSAQIINNISMYKITRPETEDTINAIVESMLNTIKEGVTT